MLKEVQLIVSLSIVFNLALARGKCLCNARVAQGTPTQQQALGETSSIIQSQHKILQD